MKGVFHCEGQSNALVVNGVHQWLEFGPIEMTAPKTSQFVIIGHELDNNEISRGWASVVD